MRWLKRNPFQRKTDQQHPIDRDHRRLECDDYRWDWSHWLLEDEKILDWGFTYRPFIPSMVHSTERDGPITTVWMRFGYTGTIIGWARTEFRYRLQEMKIRDGKVL